MQFIYYPDLPPFPKLSLDPAPVSHHQALEKKINRNGEIIPNCTCTRYRLNPVIENWARQHIDPDFDSMGLNFHGSPGGVALPHTDGTRNWSLMWILDTGGQQVRTVFWQQKGFQIERDPKFYPDSYDDLIELETHVLEPNKWVLINGNVIHSVENIQTLRKSIMIGFWNQSSFVKRHTDLLL